MRMRAAFVYDIDNKFYVVF